ncbi:MAG: Ig-like domain-containing protein [Bacteroidales bacterium]|nr:Ig-like domain-containing protein [Bacteroidales bacterium]
MQLITRPFSFFSLLVIVLLIIGCAQEMAPTGGSKDEQPPIALKSKPKNQQTLFSDKSIAITFNEFVVLKDAATQVLISPPILPKPTFSTKGKSVIINLKDSELQPNTTYNIFFGDAIQDLHEGNIIPDFHYVFSTGSTIDSLSLQGSLINAFDNSPVEGAAIMLYLNDNDTIPFDSLPYKVLPYYICRSQKNGSFYFNNLIQNDFKIFALKDENRNFLYDLPEEMIAFSDLLVQPYYIKNSINIDSALTTDSTLQTTIKTDSTTINTDSTTTTLDTTTIINTEMLMFKELDSTIKLNEIKIIDTAKAQFLFSFYTQNASFRLLRHDSLPVDSAWMFQEWSRKNDTLTAWFPQNISDTLIIEWSNNQQIMDTITVALKQSKNTTKKEKKSDNVTTPSNPIKITSNSSGSFSFFKTLVLSFSTPLTKYNWDNVIFTANKDTVITPPIIYHPETRKAFVDYSFKEQIPYSLEIPKNACFDIFGQTNDSTKIQFITDESSQYGTLKLHLTIPDSTPPIILQLLSEDGKTIFQEKIIQHSQTIDFGYLAPKKVKIKAIFDVNQNGKWDTGNYFWKIQPESTRFFEKLIEIRAYWDAEESWILK